VRLSIQRKRFDLINFFKIFKKIKYLQYKVLVKLKKNIRRRSSTTNKNQEIYIVIHTAIRFRVVYLPLKIAKQSIYYLIRKNRSS